MDIGAIATNLAAQIGTVTAYGETVTCTARLPNSINRVSLVVFPPTGVFELGAMRRRNDHYLFPIRLLRDPLDVPSRTDALYAWATALRDLVEANLDLGLGYVARATVVGARLELDGEEYAGAKVDVVEYLVDVYVVETIATVGI